MTDAHIDPVCGMRVASEKLSTLHEGTRHAFCSTHCQQKFLANPAAWLEPATADPGPGAKRECCG